MNKYKEISFDDFKEILFKYRDIEVNPADSKFKIECGRGSYTFVTKMFTEMMQSTPILTNKELNIPSIKVGYIIKTVFIAGLGFLEIEYNPKFDMEIIRTKSPLIFESLPVKSYDFELFKFKGGNKYSILKSSVLVELPKSTLFQRLKNLLKSLFN